MSFTEATIEPTPAEPAPADAPSFPSTASAPPANDEDETSLARLADDGGPPPPEADLQEVSLAPMPAEPDAPVSEGTGAARLAAPTPREPSGAEPPVPPVAAVAAPMAIPAETRSLEQRIRRLEDALAQLHEQRGMETRIAASPTAPSSIAPPPASAPAPAGGLLDVGKRLLGAAVNSVAQAPAVPPVVPPPSAGSGILWLLWDTWAEARTIVRMFVDPRYQLPWSSRIIPLVLLLLILTSKYWVPGSSIPFLGDWLLVKLVDLLLAFLLFKWLGHEARRYRQTSPDLPPTLRL